MKWIERQAEKHGGVRRDDSGSNVAGTRRAERVAASERGFGRA